jgi:hypothetical protein
MHQLVLNLPTFGLAVATRAALGAGIGLLVAERLPLERRRRIGLALVAVGAATTVPIVREILRETNEAERRRSSARENIGTRALSEA